MLNEQKFIKSGRCARKAWLIENTGCYEDAKPLPFPDIKNGKKNKVFRSNLGEATVGCVSYKPCGIELYDFFDTIKYKKYTLRMNYKRAIAESCGYNVLGVYAVTVNPDYEINSNKPYYRINRIEKPKSRAEFRRYIERIAAASRISRPAPAEMKNDCAGCEFFKGCFKLPKDNIFLLKGLDFSDKVKLYNNGIITFGDYMKSSPSPVCKMQINEETFIDKASIRAFLKQLSYPLGFLDFETISPLEPMFSGYHPGDRIITQFSYHQKNSIKSPAVHKEFIGDGLTNPEPGALMALLDATKQARNVLSYSVYEKNCVEMLAKRFPEYKSELNELALKLVDLEIPFKKHMYYTPLMEGRTSLKFVLPALYPEDKELDYNAMKISDGETAAKEYMSLKDKDEKEREKIINSLKKYCSLDSLALVKITDKLYEVSKK